MRLTSFAITCAAIVATLADVATQTAGKIISGVILAAIIGRETTIAHQI